MKHFFTIFISLLSQQCLCQEYAVNLIPDSLKENANAVLRKEELFVDIRDIDKAVVHHKYAITILNETGDMYAIYQEQYDKLISLSDINGTLYDANGTKIKSVKRRDIKDYSDDGDNFYTDNRVKTFSFHYKNYPYTVEFEDEQIYNGIYLLPQWSPVINSKTSVQQSKFIVETPLDYELRYKQFNITKEPLKTVTKKINYTWELSNYKAVELVILAPDFIEMVPNIMLAPSKFSISGYTGNMSSWKELGKFQTVLNKGRDVLPDNIKAKIHELTDKLKTEEEKVKTIYQYLQSNTRYISIQLGIGGWQPLPASFVGEKKYGDCKALSNFMVSLLKEINIKANYVIINSGKNVSVGLFEDFPCKYSNHIVTCVPLKNDTIWLECTSQTSSAGYMGTSTGNRKALMITDSGGVVVNTPKFIASQNKSVRNVSATIDETGTLKLNAASKLTGTEQETEHSLLTDVTQEQRLEYLNKLYDLPTYTVDKIEYKETQGRIPQIDESLVITAPAFANITGKRMFLQPNLFNKESKLPNNKPRIFDIVYRVSYINIDSIEIKIPVGYTIEMMPKNIALDNKFGKYKIDYSYINETIKVIRYYEQSANRFPAKDYPELVSFYDKMASADRAKMVLVKQ